MKKWLKKQLKLWWISRKLRQLEEDKLMFGVPIYDDYIELKEKLYRQYEEIKNS